MVAALVVRGREASVEERHREEEEEGGDDGAHVGAVARAASGSEGAEH